MGTLCVLYLPSSGMGSAAGRGVSVVGSGRDVSPLKSRSGDGNNIILVRLSF